MRREYKLTDAQIEELKDLSKPKVYIVVGGHGPTSQQDDANHWWQRLALEMGFDVMTVGPVVGKPEGTFTAEVSK